MASRRLQLVLDLDTGGYSGKLRSAAGEMRTFNGVVDRTNKTVHTAGQSFDTFAKTARRPLDSLRDYVLILGNLRLAFMAVRDVSMGWAGEMVRQSAEVERLTILMKGLSDASDEFGKKLDASSSLGRLFDMARENGVAVGDLTDAFVKFKSGGVDPANGSLQSLTDAVAKFGGTSETFHRASIAIQQMAGKGVVSMEELRQQLGEAVPTAMKDMARAAGMELAEFTKQVSRGRVQAGPALELMFRDFQMLYSGAGAKIADTLNGQMAQIRTNSMELSTFFTGLAEQNNSRLSYFVASQQRLLEEGRITKQEFDASIEEFSNGAGDGNGLYSGVVDALKEINEAMQSSDAKVFFHELGAGAADVLRALMAAGRAAVEWRDTITTAVKAAAAGFIALQGIKIANWLSTVGVTGVAALGGITKATTPLGDALERGARRLQNYSDAITGAKEKSEGLARAAQQAGNVSRAQAQALANEASRLGQLKTQYESNIVTLQRQKQVSDEILRVGQQTGRYRDLETGKFLSQKRVIEQNAAATEGLARNKKALAATSRSLTAVETQLATAQRTVATSAVIEAQESNAAAAAKTRSATASALAASAARGLGTAVNIALGPIGQLILLLGTAAYAAGVFENKADKAAAAAARLAQGIASLEDIKEAQSQLEKLRGQQEDLIELRKKGFRELDTGDGKKIIQYLSDDDKARIDKELDKLEESQGRFKRALNIGNTAIIIDEGNKAVQGLMVERTAALAKSRHEFQEATKEADGNIKQIDAARKKAQTIQKAYDEQALKSLEARRAEAAAAGKSTLVFDTMIESYKQSVGITDNVTQSTEELRESLMGTGKGADKTAKAFERLRDKFAKMIGSNAGRIADLKAQLIGGSEELDKFNAKLEVGANFKGINDAEIKKLRDQFAEIDRLNKEIDFNQNMERLGRSATRAHAETEQLFESLANDSMAADRRLAQVRSRFEDILETTDDPEKVAKIKELMEALTADKMAGDAAVIADNWRDATEEIRIGLLTEDEQREANLQREIKRQYDLIDWTRLSASQRAQVEQQYNAYVDALRQRSAREGESDVVKMARSWIQIGDAIDKGVVQSLNAFTDSLADGKFAFADFAKSIIKMLLKVIIQAMVAYAILSAIGATGGQSFGSFVKGGMTNFANGFGGGASSGTTGGDITVTHGGDLPIHHTGGWIGSQPLKAGDVPIIGQEEEVVLNKEQQRFYGSVMENAGSSVNNVEVNVINNSGTPVSAESSEPRFDGRKMIVDVVVEAMNKEGPMRQSIQRIQQNG